MKSKGEQMIQRLHAKGLIEKRTGENYRNAIVII